MHVWLRNARECERHASEVQCEITRSGLVRNAQMWRDMAGNLARFRHRALMARLQSLRRDSRGRFTAQEDARR